MFKFFIVILITVFLSNCQTTNTNYKSKNSPYKVDLEDCLDKFFGPQVPLGKIENYQNWVMNGQNSLRAQKICSTEINAFLLNANYEIDRRYLGDDSWIKAMTIVKNNFKPNQKKGKKRFFNPHGDPIGEWWAIPVGVVK